MKVVLRNPRRELEVRGPKTVTALLSELDLNPESVLVIADDELVPKDARLADTVTVEIRPVMSGGATGADVAVVEHRNRTERPSGRGGATDADASVLQLRHGTERPHGGGAT